MRVSFPEQKPAVAVAIAFDERLESLLAAAAFFGRRLGAPLHLIHVCDPWTKSHLAAAVEGGDENLVQALKDETERVAGRRLEALRAALDPGLAVTTTVVAGDVVQSLVAEVEGTDAGLLLVGASKGGVAGTALGFSTAVSLINESPVPVLVLNEAAHLSPAEERLTVLVADDFTPVAEAALDLALRLALILPGSSLVHAHVASYDELNLGRRQSLLDSGKPRPPLTASRLREQLHEAEEKLLIRGGDGPGRIESAGGRYRTEVMTGLVPEELDRTAAACRASLAVYGQHRVFHRRAMHAGQVPFKAMLSQDRPVLVVPQPGEA